MQSVDSNYTNSFLSGKRRSSALYGNLSVNMREWQWRGWIDSDIMNNNDRYFLIVVIDLLVRMAAQMSPFLYYWI